jgi:hypothetical protein
MFEPGCWQPAQGILICSFEKKTQCYVVLFVHFQFSRSIHLKVFPSPTSFLFLEKGTASRRQQQLELARVPNVTHNSSSSDGGGGGGSSSLRI